MRRSYNEPLLAAMVVKVTEAQAAGRLPLDLEPFVTAGAMLAALDRLTSFRQTFERRGTSRDAMVATVGRILHTAHRALTRRVVRPQRRRGRLPRVTESAAAGSEGVALGSRRAFDPASTR